MNKAIVKKLNKLNADFYDKIGEYFDSSRQYYWEGWEELWNFMIQNQLSVYSILDIACGNARFYRFLQDRLDALCHTGHETVKYEGSIIENGFAYTGIDNNQYLLSQAIFSNTSTEGSKTSAELFFADFINDEIEFEGKYDLVTSFGFLHHVPSYEKRLEFFMKLKNLLNEDGIACISIWKFLEDEREKKKIVAQDILDKLKIKPQELEINDFILSWNRGKQAYRYCHYVDQEELYKLIKESGLKLIKSFRADGKENNLNEYLILSK